MDFYNILSRYYDEIFPLDEDCARFVGGHCRPGMKLMDAGCGSGALVKYLRDQGVDARGFDLDPAMVEKARGRFSGSQGDDVFQVGDISDAAPILGDEKFDVITCLGNTAVHIDFSRQIRFLGQVCGSLKPGGLFILQILNYTNILEEGQGFSVLESENCRFIREYKTSGDKGRLFFHTSLEDRNSGEVFRNSVTHYPLLPEALMALLSMSAFAEWETMGGWDGSPAGSGRLPLIVAARSEK